MATSQYAWSAGHGVALISLNNIENQLRPYNYRAIGGPTRAIGIRSQPIDAFPVRTLLASGYERGDGWVNQSLEMVLTTYAYKRALDLYLSGGAVVSAPMTFYLRRHELNDYARYNGYLNLPSQARGDIEYLRQNLLRVIWPLTRLIAI